MNSARISAPAAAACALMLISSVACHDFRNVSAPGPVSSTLARIPFALVVDGAHTSGGGNSNFYFLPPLVQSPHYSGTRIWPNHRQL